MSKRHQEPKFIIEWRNAKTPQCCHTCDHYLPNGECRKYNSIPPEDFAMTVDACESWELEVPF